MGKWPVANRQGLATDYCQLASDIFENSPITLPKYAGDGRELSII